MLKSFSYYIINVWKLSRDNDLCQNVDSDLIKNWSTKKLFSLSHRTIKWIIRFNLSSFAFRKKNQSVKNLASSRQFAKV